LLRKAIKNYQPFPNTPIYPSAPSIINRPSSVITYDGNNNRLAETDYAYDQVGVGSVSSTGHDETNYSASYNNRGNATTTTKQCFPNCANAVTTYTYDETGQVLTMKDPNGQSTGAITQYSYADNYASGFGTPPGNTNAYLTRITRPTTPNGAAHVESFQYGYNDGQSRRATDENGKNTQYVYNDPLARLSETDYPDGGQTTISYNDAGPSPSVTTSRLMSPGNSLTTLSVMDGLGHVVETLLTPDPDCASGDRTDKTYDGLGRVRTVSNPYCTTSDPTYGITTYNDDALGRSTQVTNPDNSTMLTTYTGRATQVQDEGNGTQRVQRISQTDALGRLTSVCEVSNASLIGSGGAPAACGQDIPATGFLTTYQYDALDNLTQVNQAGISSRTFTYDSLSRLTSASNPESGTISYTYDANGNLAQKTDARGITTTYTHDALNRLTGKTYSDGTPAATFNYDQSSALGVTLTNAIGRKSSQSTAGPNATGSVFSYDAMGRVADNSQCTPQNCGSGVSALQYTQYDLVGDLLSATNAAGITFSYAYSGAARLTTPALTASR